MSALIQANQIITSVYDNLQSTVRHQFDIQQSPDQSAEKQDLLHEAIEDFIEYIQDHSDEPWGERLNEDYVFSSIISNFKQHLYNETKHGQVRAKYEGSLKAQYQKRTEAEAEKMVERLDVEDLKQQFDKPIDAVIETIVETYEKDYGEGGDVARELQRRFGLSTRKVYQLLNFIRQEAKQHGFSNEEIQTISQ